MAGVVWLLVELILHEATVILKSHDTHDLSFVIKCEPNKYGYEVNRSGRHHLHNNTTTQHQRSIQKSDSKSSDGNDFG